MLSSVDDRLSPTEKALSAVAGNNKLFLEHNNSPIFAGQSLDNIARLLVTTYEAIQTLSYCRSQFSDSWLAAQGEALGLNLDETFVANYEHLLLRVQTELINALTRKALEELLHPKGGHDKNQRKLLGWFTEFAKKPRPLSTSFPWTIKPSLAVLWGVSSSCVSLNLRVCADSRLIRSAGCFTTLLAMRPRMLKVATIGSQDPVCFNTSMFRGPLQDRLNVSFACCVCILVRVFQLLNWSDFNFGLQLIGSQPQLEAQQQTGNNVLVGLESDVFDAARNADTWSPNWQHLESSHPSLTEAHLTPIGSAATPRFPGKE